MEAGEASVIYGGLATMNWRASKTEQFLSGKPINEETLRAALAVLKQEVRECTSSQHEMDEEGISRAYRRQLAENFFYKFVLHVALGRRSEAGRRGECVGGESSRPAAVVGDAGVHRVSGTIPRDEADHQASRVCPGLGRGQVHAGCSPAGRRAARGDGQELAGACAFLDHAQGRHAGSPPGVAPARSIPTSRRSSRWPTSRREARSSSAWETTIPCSAMAWSPRWGRPIGLAVAETIATAREAAAFIEKECIAYEDLPAVLTLDEAIEQNTAMPMIRKVQEPRRRRAAADSRGHTPRQRPGVARQPGSEPSRHRTGDRVLADRVPRRTSTWKPCAPWPSPACTTR